MRTYVALFFLCIAFLANAQKSDSRIVIGTVDTVNSGILKEKRIIYVHVPDGNKKEHYPVLYVLDGEDHFQSAVAIVEQISGILPNMVIVGITNTDRERDLTPTHVNPDFNINAGDARRSGGGENFMTFIEKELIPYVDAHYPTTAYRTISGHSLGGLTVINAFFNHTELFNAYIAIDPSLWWEKSNWIKKYENELPKRVFNNKALFVAIANNLTGGLDTNSVLKDTSSNFELTKSVLGFTRSLKSSNPKGLRWGSKFYPDEWHGSVELNAEYDALRYLFKFYHFDMNKFRERPEMNADSLISAHFSEVSDKMGYKVLPTENLVNQMGYACMGIHKMDIAYVLFKKNTENYPQSANAFDSLGDFYVAQGNNNKAIEAFSKSLSLQETQDTRRKLEELKSKR
ncbi:MAG TPA: alpha/beta hydrolase-fold protein [Mucilaginibacter sp.]|jgi:hypothetical protein